LSISSGFGLELVVAILFSVTRIVFFPGRAAGYRNKLIHELKAAEGKRDWGLFIDSCSTHCQTPFSSSWHSPTSPRLGNKVRSISQNCTLTATAKQELVPFSSSSDFFLAEQTIAEAVGDWYFGRRKGTMKQIDCKYPCNPTCGS